MRSLLAVVVVAFALLFAIQQKAYINPVSSSSSSSSSSFNYASKGTKGSGVTFEPMSAEEVKHVKDILVRSRRSLTIQAAASGNTVQEVKERLLAQMGEMPEKIAKDLVDKVVAENSSVATVMRDEAFDRGTPNNARESYVYLASFGSVFAGARGKEDDALTDQGDMDISPAYRAWVRVASTHVERAEEQLGTETVREEIADGTHFCNCWITWFGCDTCPVYRTRENSKPVMGLRPLTLEMQQALLHSIEISNAESMQKLLLDSDSDGGPGMSVPLLSEPSE